MFELQENSKKEIKVFEEGMLKNATTKITQFHKIAKNAILGISLILADIADKPKEYLEGSGYNSIAEYAEEVFGYKKAYTYKLIKIAKFICIKGEENEVIDVSYLINDTIRSDYNFETLADSDGFEYSPSQLLELIPLDKKQIKENIDKLDSSLTCKELRQVVKDIISPPVETTASDSTDVHDTKQEENKEKKLTDNDRILKMLEICSEMENEEIKEKIVKVFQKSLKALEKAHEKAPQTESTEENKEETPEN